MNDFETKAKAIIEWLTGEYTGIRTGQATPQLLDSVKVEKVNLKMHVFQFDHFVTIS